MIIILAISYPNIHRNALVFFDKAKTDAYGSLISKSVYHHMQKGVIDLIYTLTFEFISISKIE